MIASRNPNSMMKKTVTSNHIGLVLVRGRAPGRYSSEKDQMYVNVCVGGGMGNQE